MLGKYVMFARFLVHLALYITKLSPNPNPSPESNYITDHTLISVARKLNPKSSSSHPPGYTLR